MAVVINEFEVVPGESKPPAQEAQPPRRRQRGQKVATVGT